LVTPSPTIGPGWATVAKAYVYTLQDHAVSYTLQQTMTAGVASTGTAMPDTSHAPFLSQPEQRASTLSGL
jgi:hypothetical protein